MQTTFTWSAEHHSDDQGTGKRTKTSHYNEIKVPTSLYSDVKVVSSHYGEEKLISAFNDTKVPVSSYNEGKASSYNDMLHNLPTSGTTISSWDIDGGLAADFDGSLSGLGAELGSTTYNMSEALLALPVFKQENLDNGYQYILGAATSPAVKANEETLTYLNQGQSYEIKLKKLGDLSEYEGYLRSTVRVCFHERRLQYMEKEQMDSWMNMRPGERILDIDIPLSYGLIDVVVDPNRLNTIDFIWDPTKESGIYVKVNCISTEFTAKKHGGEKGVPFRLQLETKESDSESAKMMHCASCQIKVFKPKGADRKHKTDREKMEKRTGSEKEKYQPSYECTVLTEIPVDQVNQSTTSRNGMSSNIGSFGSLAQAFKDQSGAASTQKQYKTVSGTSMEQWRWHSTSSGSPPKQSEAPPTTPGQNDRKPYVSTAGSTGKASEPPSPYSIGECGSPLDAITCIPQSLSIEATDKEVTAWLQFNRFSNYVNVFQNFSGADLLRLTRDDLIQICGLADGIRLNNALQSRTVRPRLTVYMCREPGTVYHAVYMEQLTSHEMVGKIADLIKIQRYNISNVFVQGPSNIHILLTDEVVRNFQEQSRYWLEVIKEVEAESPEYVRVLLKGIE